VKVVAGSEIVQDERARIRAEERSQPVGSPLFIGTQEMQARRLRAITGEAVGERFQ